MLLGERGWEAFMSGGSSRRSKAGSTSAARMRRHRERRRCGLTVVKVEVSEEMIARWIEQGRLPARDASHPDRIAEVVEEIVENDPGP
jgi:hypothetical protein